MIPELSYEFKPGVHYSTLEHLLGTLLIFADQDPSLWSPLLWLLVLAGQAVQTWWMARIKRGVEKKAVEKATEISLELEAQKVTVEQRHAENIARLNHIHDCLHQTIIARLDDLGATLKRLEGHFTPENKASMEPAASPPDSGQDK